MRRYEDLNLIHENTMQPRSDYIPYDSLEKALAGDKEQSEFYTLLNGEWDFKYFARDIDCPETISNWDKVIVPSCWQMTVIFIQCFTIFFGGILAASVAMKNELACRILPVTSHFQSCNCQL